MEFLIRCIHRPLYKHSQFNIDERSAAFISIALVFFVLLSIVKHTILFHIILCSLFMDVCARLTL